MTASGPQARTRATDPPVVRIAAPDGETKRLWKKVIELAVDLGEDPAWTLVGGLMVQLHAFEHRSSSRATTDIDVLGDSRRRPAMTQRIAKLIEKRGGEMAMPPTSDESLGYQFNLDGDVVEVLGSEGVSSNPKTVGKYSTFQVPGGSQALRRSETVLVGLDERPAVPVRRPNLLGALLIKARVVAIEREEKFDSDRQDLVLLLSLVEDPRALAANDGMKNTERGWLRKVEEKIGFRDPYLGRLFPPATVTRAEQAFKLLTEGRPSA
jgi:hypothetical protein